MTQKMRKTLVFSKKNSDIFEVLSEMQSNNENISEYICSLIRQDKLGETNANLENLTVKVDAILGILNNNGGVRTSESNILKTTKTETAVEYLTSDIDSVNSSNIDKILGI